MSDIILGNNFQLYYNPDIGNASPTGIDNVEIDNLAGFPVLTIQSDTSSYDTYDSDYVSKLLADMSVGDMEIVVNYVPDSQSAMFLDSALLNQTEFQLILVYYYDTVAGQISYAIVNGQLFSSNVSGDKDSVVQKTYNFTTTQLRARSTVAVAPKAIFEGDFGIGSDGLEDGIPQYEPDIPSGNSFIKIPAAQSGNPAAVDLMGIGWTDNSQVCELAVTKAGALAIYAKNASTAWTRISTTTLSDATYVPLTRTINGYALSSNITLTKSDVGLGNVLNVASYSKTESDTNLSGAVATLVPKTTTVNGHALSANITVTASDVGLGNVLNVPSYSKTESDANLSGAIDTLNTSISDLNTSLTDALVPKTTTVNGHDLSDDVVITKGDVGLGNVLNVPSYSKTESDTNLSGAVATLVPKTTTVNAKPLSGNITLASADVGALSLTGGTVGGNLTVTGTTTLSNALAITSGGTGGATLAAAQANLGINPATLTVTADLNTATTNMHFRWDTSSTNVPLASTVGYGTTIATSGAQLMQLAYIHGSLNSYIRFYASGTWSAWALDAYNSSELSTAWINITGDNGWTNHSAQGAQSKFRKIFGRVYVTMNLTNGTQATQFFTLPTGYRPAANTFFVGGTSNNTVVPFYINPSGVCQLVTSMTLSNVAATFSFDVAS